MRTARIVVTVALLFSAILPSQADRDYEVLAINMPPLVKTLHKNVDDVVILKPVKDANIKCDGLLDEPQWKTALQFGPLGRLKAQSSGYKGNKADDTYVRMFCDRQNLYVAAILHEADMSRLRESVKSRDGALWADDCFELFIDPYGLRKEYCHLIVNPAAVAFDAWITRSGSGKKNTRVAWNPAWKKAASKQGDRWIVEVVLPLGMFDSPASDFMVVNLAREQARNSGLACWANVIEYFHAVEDYKLVSLKDTSIIPREISIDSFVYGKNVAGLKLKNIADGPASAKLFAKIDGKRIASADIKLKPHAVSSFNLQFNLKVADFGRFMQLGYDAGGGEVILAGVEIPKVRPVELHALTGLVCLNQQVKLKGQVNLSSAAALKEKASLIISRNGKVQRTLQLAQLESGGFYLTFKTAGLGAGKYNAVLQVGQKASSDVGFEIIPGPFD